MIPTDRQFAAYFGIPLPGDGSALDNAVEHFETASSGEDPLLQCSLALRSLLLAYVRQDHKAQPFDAVRLWDLTANAGMTVVRTTDALPMHRAIAGFDNVRELISLLALPEVPEMEQSGLLLDRLDQVALFANELDTTSRRAAINARGAPLARFNAVRAALFADVTETLRH